MYDLSIDDSGDDFTSEFPAYKWCVFALAFDGVYIDVPIGIGIKDANISNAIDA